MDEGWQPVIIFTDQSNSFACGVEAGMLYKQFQFDTNMIDTVSHTENREVLTAMAESEGWDISITESDTEGWDYLVATKKQIKDNPKLTIVK